MDCVLLRRKLIVNDHYCELACVQLSEKMLTFSIVHVTDDQSQQFWCVRPPGREEILASCLESCLVVVRKEEEITQDPHLTFVLSNLIQLEGE